MNEFYFPNIFDRNEDDWTILFRLLMSTFFLLTGAFAVLRFGGFELKLLDFDRLFEKKLGSLIPLLGLNLLVFSLEKDLDRKFNPYKIAASGKKTGRNFLCTNSVACEIVFLNWSKNFPKDGVFDCNFIHFLGIPLEGRERPRSITTEAICGSMTSISAGR